MQLHRKATVPVGLILAALFGCFGLAEESPAQPAGTSFAGRTGFAGGTSFVGGTSITGPGSITGIEQNAAAGLGHPAVERVAAYTNLSIDSSQGSLRTFVFGRRIPQRDRAIVVQGSARVTVNGMLKQEGVHYLIDYQGKQITFFQEVDPQALIQISYRWLGLDEVRQFTYGGVSGVTEAGEDRKAAAAINAQPVLGEGVLFRAGDLRMTVRQLTQAGSSSQPGAVANPNIAARQLSLVLGEQGQNQPGTSVRVDWAMSQTLRRDADPEMRRLARFLGVADPSACFDQDGQPQDDGCRDVARTLSLSHRSRALTVEGQVQEIGKQFAAAPQLGYDPSKRGYRTERFSTALALAERGDSGLTASRRAIRGNEAGLDGSMTLEERSLRLGTFEYRQNVLSISRDFKPDQALAQQLVNEYGFAQRKQGTAAKGLVAPPFQLAGVRDVQQHWGWQPSKSLQLTRDSREITDAQGASLREHQQVATLLGGMVQVSQSEFEMSHDFSLAPQVGYENRAGHRGHRYQDLSIQFRPTPALALTHGEHKVYTNPSGGRDQGQLSVRTENALQWKLTPRTNLSLAQWRQTAGSEAAKAAGDSSQLTTVRQRSLTLDHQLSDNTKVSLADTLTRSEQGDQDTSQRQQLWGLQTRLGMAQVDVRQDRQRRPDATRWVRTSYSLAMGAAQATYAEVSETDQDHKTRLDLRYQRPLSRQLSLSTRYLRVKNWKEHDQAPEYRSLVATEAELSYKPSDVLSLSVWQRARNIAEDARYLEQGVRWEYKLGSMGGLRGQLQRTERDRGHYVASRDLALSLTPTKRISLEAGYQEASDPQGVVRPSHFFKGTLQPWQGLSFTGHYTARDQGETKGLTTKGYTVSQQLGTGGEVKVSYLENPLNEKGQIVPRTEESYSLTLPREWTGDRFSLKGSYSLLDDRAQGKGAAAASGELTWKPSHQDSLRLTYAQQYHYQQNVSSAQGTFTYELRYSHQLSDDQEWGVKGQYVGYLGEGVRSRTGRRSDYRIEADFRLTF